MTQTCPRCLHLNNDEVKFCTSCGNALIPGPGHPETGEGLTPPVSPAPVPVPAAGTSPLSGPKESPFNPKVIIIAVIAIMVITAALVFLQTSGTFRIFPSSAPAAAPHGTLTPVVTSTIIIETPSPDVTTVPTEPPLATTVPETSRTSPTPTKAITCPSDRHLCGSNCTDTMTDPDNCGDCGVSCYSGKICQMGHCMSECDTGEISCYDGCHNLSTDAKNCGTCGNTCPVGLVCNSSVCSPPLKTAVPTYLG